MNEKEWLESLKEGDEVYVAGRYGAVGTIEKVKRLTAKQIIVGHREAFEVRYRKEDGFLVGGEQWSRGHIAPVDDDKRELVERMELRTFIRRYLVDGGLQWKDIPTGKLKRIVAIMKEGAK